MKKYFFLDPNLFKRISALLFILFFLSFKTFLIVLLFSILWLYLFRRIKHDDAKIRATDDSIFLSPASGTVRVKKSGKVTKVYLRVNLLGGYGISMPFSGDVTSYFETTEMIKIFNFIPIKRTKIVVTLKSDVLGQAKFIISRQGLIFEPFVWVRSGDKGLVGAYLGYLPFGGKLVIEIEKDLNLLVKDNDRVQALLTLLASSRTKND